MKKFLSCLLSALLALTVLPLAAGCGEKKAEAALAYNDGSTKTEVTIQTFITATTCF